MWLEGDDGKVVNRIINLEHVREIQAEQISGGGSRLVATFLDGNTSVLRQFAGRDDALSVLRGHLIERELKGKVLTLPPLKPP